MAVRDRNWDTIPPVYSNVHQEIGSDRFHISYEVENRQDDIHFRWQGHIQGDPDGTITFRIVGQAATTFMKNRIGLCVLHPARVAGTPCTITCVDGSQRAAAFPSQISPDQPPLPFTDIISLAYKVGNAQVDITFAGDIFEMEDQRNWTDASFKTYCPPVRLPYPVEISAGAMVCQTITIRARWTARPIPIHPRIEAGLTLNVSHQPVGRLPCLGTGIASHGAELSLQEIARLRALKLSHLRVDIWPADPLFPEIFQRAVAQSRALDVPLCLAMHLTEKGEAEIGAFKQLVLEIKPRVAIWLVYPAVELFLGGSPTAQAVAWVKNSGIAALLQIPYILASGTDADFIFLQRNLPPLEQVEAVCFAINPQVHAFDNASVMETLEAQPMTVANARQLSRGRPVLVSSVTLRPRHNPYATGAIPATPLGELPSQVDYRQPSLFAAAWLVGSLRAMALGGASAVSYFETTGRRGLMETEAGSPMPGKFRSIPGAVFPVYHVLADVADYVSDGSLIYPEVLAATSSNALKMQGLALSGGDSQRLLIANLTSEIQAVTVRGLPAQVSVRYLDETNVVEAMINPESYRAQISTRDTTNGKHKFDLCPYAVIKIDSM